MKTSFYNLSPAREKLANKKGRKIDIIEVGKYERPIFSRRSPQSRKAQMIRDFANRYLRLCETAGVDKDDVRETIALMIQMDDMVLAHQRGPSQWQFVRKSHAK